MNVLDSRDVVGVIGVGNVFIIIVCRGSSARASGGAGGPRGEVLVSGGITVATPDFPNDLRFALGSRPFVAGRQGQNTV